MRCDICKNFNDCETTKDLRYTFGKMIMREKVLNTPKSLHEAIYILVPQYCAEYKRDKKVTKYYLGGGCRTDKRTTRRKEDV